MSGIGDAPVRVWSELARAYALEGPLAEESGAWRVRARRGDRNVLLTVLPDAGDGHAIRRALAPAVVASRHEHAAEIVDVLDVHGLTVLVEARAEGVSLRTWLEREGRLPFLEGRLVLLGIASALAAAHAAGVAHGDLRAERVTWSDARAVVDGFGVARGSGRAVAPSDDVRAFGALAHEVLAGARFESGGPAVSRLREHVPPGLARLVVRALDPDPLVRPEAREIERTVAGLVTPNPAYRAPHLVAQARFLARRRGGHLAAAQERYARALEIDSGHAAAHAGLAETVCRRAQRGAPGADDAAVRALAAADRALELDPSLAEAHVARALCDLVLRHDLAAARTRVEAALALDDPGRAARIEAAVLAVRAGEPDAALLHATIATRDVPADPCAWRALGWARLGRGESAGACAAFQRAVELADSPEDRASLARAGRQAGATPPRFDPSEAIG